MVGRLSDTWWVVLQVRVKRRCWLSKVLRRWVTLIGGLLEVEASAVVMDCRGVALAVLGDLCWRMERKEELETRNL